MQFTVLTIAYVIMTKIQTDAAHTRAFGQCPEDRRIFSGLGKDRGLQERRWHGNKGGLPVGGDKEEKGDGAPGELRLVAGSPSGP